jgi:hypothetical protein
MASRGLLLAGGAVVGTAAGWVLAQRRFERHRRDLFHRHPLRRLGALGFLAGQNGVETVRLLRDYLRWETHPMLRRRATAMLTRMERSIGRGAHA